jgi:hypothetical protein
MPVLVDQHVYQKKGLVYVFPTQPGCQIVTATIPTIKLEPDFNDLACKLFEINRDFRIPPSPPASLNCRETAPPFAPKCAKHARIRKISSAKRTEENELLGIE